MLQQWLIGMAISFAIRQVAKFGKTTNWQVVKEDLRKRVEALVPGKWFDDEAVAVANLAVDTAARILSSATELEKIMKLLAARKFEQAVQTLMDLVMRSMPVKFEKAAVAQVAEECIDKPLFPENDGASVA